MPISEVGVKGGRDAKVKKFSGLHTLMDTTFSSNVLPLSFFTARPILPN